MNYIRCLIKKVKKSTIKIIIDQQKEIKELRFNLSELRKQGLPKLKDKQRT